MTNVNNDACGVAWREQNGESGVHMTHPGGRGSGVKKIDQVAVRIAEQHRSIAPGLIRGFLNPGWNDRLKP
jgi:hypothetical protein